MVNETEVKKIEIDVKEFWDYLDEKAEALGEEVVADIKALFHKPATPKPGVKVETATTGSSSQAGTQTAATTGASVEGNPGTGEASAASSIEGSSGTNGQ